MMCTTIRVGMPGDKCSQWVSWRSGITTAWEGMNIPNRKSVKSVSAPGKRHRASTKPLTDPMNEEISAAGIASSNVRSRDGCSEVQAVFHPAVVQCEGSAHAPVAEVSLAGL